VVRLTNLDKVLFPAARRRRALTKRDFIRHHAVMAPVMLPYLHDRAVNLHRYPDGAGTKGFWQKEAPSGAPEWIPRWHYEDADPDETQYYLVLDSPGALVWVAQNGAIELHPWTSRTAEPHEPTWALIDIDPGTKSTFEDALVLARLYRTALDHLGVDGRPKLTGKRGIQIFVPVASAYSFDDTRAWVEKISRAIGDTVPDMVSWEWEKAKRRGRTRLDYTQNAVNKTLIAPFSARPEAGGPVSVPIDWAELDDPELRADRWTIHDVVERVATAGDPLAPLIGVQQRLPRL
jgi:bifunctional non-homologous end joining protein LigD